MSDASRSGDPEVARLLLEEFRRLENILGGGKAPEEQRRAVHSLKGSTGVAGEHGLWEALSRIERRLAAGDKARAAEAYRTSLKLQPGRRLSLAGLAKAMQ